METYLFEKLIRRIIFLRNEQNALWSLLLQVMLSKGWEDRSLVRRKFEGVSILGVDQIRTESYLRPWQIVHSSQSEISLLQSMSYFLSLRIVIWSFKYSTVFVHLRHRTCIAWPFPCIFRDMFSEPQCVEGPLCTTDSSLHCMNCRFR